MSASVAELDVSLTGYQEVVSLTGYQKVVGSFRRLQVRPPQSRQHPFVEIDHEILSVVILSLPLIQEGQLSVSGE